MDAPAHDLLAEQAPASDTKTVTHSRATLPTIGTIIRPRLGLLTFCLGLIIIGRTAALALPYSTRMLIDQVIGEFRLLRRGR